MTPRSLVPAALLLLAAVPCFALPRPAAASPTTTSLTAAVYTITTGANGAISATVAGGSTTPTGTVKFLFEGEVFASEPLTSGTATLTAGTAGLAPGVYSISAQYGGDSTHAASASAAVTFTLQTVKDCSGGVCPAIVIANDPPASGDFHGYADPSMRKDPNSGVIYLSYSWEQEDPANDSLAVDLHLAHSTDGGSTWTGDGPLFTTTQYDNTTSSNYAAVNATSFEVSDLLPASLNGVTYWAQAHREYLIGSGESDYQQADATGVIALSVYALPDAAANPAALINIAAQKQTLLGTYTTDSTIGANVDLSSLSPDVSACATFDQPALYFEGSTLYLAAECEIVSGSGATGEDLEFPVFSTVPNSLDPTQWTWKYNGTFATRAQASALGKREGTAYQFLTELEFVKARNGQLLALFSPSVLNATGTQPVVQYGCRFAPVLSLDPPTMLTDPTGAPETIASVTESDLEATPNEGPGACTYEPAANTGVVLVHKLEKDPVEGFYTTLVASGVTP